MSYEQINDDEFRAAHRRMVFADNLAALKREIERPLVDVERDEGTIVETGHGR